MTVNKYNLADPSLCSVAESCSSHTCKGKFLKVSVVPRISGETIIQWSFVGTGLQDPVEFRVLVAPTGLDNQPWQIVSHWAADITAVGDSQPRSFGWLRLAYYRVEARDGDGNIYQSEPVAANQAFSSLSHYKAFREIVRVEQKRQQARNTPTLDGYLLKVRYYGQPCYNCVDPNIGSPMVSNCPVCFGTGKRYGYYPPLACFRVDISSGSYDVKMLNGQPPSIDGNQYKMRLLNIPEVHPWDVWVDKATDYRFMIGQIQPIASVGLYPVVCNAAASRLSFDHPAYKVPVHADQKPFMFFQG